MIAPFNSRGRRVVAAGVADDAVATTRNVTNRTKGIDTALLGHVTKRCQNQDTIVLSPQVAATTTRLGAGLGAAATNVGAAGTHGVGTGRNVLGRGGGAIPALTADPDSGQTVATDGALGLVRYVRTHVSNVDPSGVVVTSSEGAETVTTAFAATGRDNIVIVERDKGKKSGEESEFEHF